MQSPLQNDLAIYREHVAAIKKKLVKPPSGYLRFPYVTAGHESYAYLIDWDAVWGGLTLLIDGESDPLKYSILNLLDHTQPDGKGQRVIRPTGYGAPAFHNRPFIALGAYILSRETHSVDWLDDEQMARLSDNILYWHKNRIGRSGLAKWLSVDEGFADNGLGNWAWDENSVEAVDLNAQLVVENASVAWIAERRGNKFLAGRHRALAEQLVVRLNQFLWSEEKSAYFSLYNPSERRFPPYFIEVNHYTNLWPLWYGLAPKARANAMIENILLKPEQLWGPHGVRSMSKSDPNFNNAERGITLPMPARQITGPGINYRSSNWQGPLWTLTNYVAAMGLMRYGYREQAFEAGRRLIHCLAEGIRSHGSLYENYHSETGEPLASPGIASWAIMCVHLLDHLDSGENWLIKGLDLPSPA